MAAVTLTVAKSFLQISHTAEDTWLEDVCIPAAEQAVKGITNIYLHSGDGSVSEYLDGGDEALWPHYLPVNSVTSVLDTESGNASYTSELQGGRILRSTSNNKWGTGVKRWLVTYDAGYAEASAPAWYKQAVLDLIMRAYKVRGDIGEAANMQDLTKGDWAARLGIHRMDRGGLG